MSSTHGTMPATTARSGTWPRLMMRSSSSLWDLPKSQKSSRQVHKLNEMNNIKGFRDFFADTSTV